MNVFQLLKQDHDKVKELFKEYEACGDGDFRKKREIAETVFHELDVHAKVEEEIFYPAVEEEANEETEKLVNEAFEEHRVIKRLIDEMKKLETDDDRFDAKFKVLRENVEHHIEEEQDELFPEAREALKDEVEEITEEIQDRKEDLEAGFFTSHKNGRSHEKKQQPVK